MARIRVDAFECDVCGHRWLSHDVPKRCARCKSRGWDRSSADVPQLREQAQAEKQERKANLQESVADVLKAKEPPARAIPLIIPFYKGDNSYSAAYVLSCIARPALKARNDFRSTRTSSN